MLFRKRGGFNIDKGLIDYNISLRPELYQNAHTESEAAHGLLLNLFLSTDRIFIQLIHAL
jgi:hypothetical protein